MVTARRRAEAVQNVPEAVAAFSQQQLTQKAIRSSFDVGKSVPGLTVDADSGNPALPSFAIRGRGQNYGAAAGSVETYFAEVPLSAPFQIPTLPPQFFDLASFQVLKGPQGTLFGRSTTGGAVLIVPQAPTDHFGGYLRLQGGSYGDFQAEGAINLPIVSDKALLRVAFFDWQRDGYMHTFPGTPDTATLNGPVHILPSQTFDNVDETEVRATLLLKPTDKLTNSTIITYHTDETRASPGSGLNLLGPGALPGSTPTGLSTPGIASYYSPGYGTYWTHTGVNLSKPRTNVWAVINTTSYALTDDLTLKNIFGFIDAKGYTNDGEDSDGTSLPYIDVLVPPHARQNWQYTDELQLQGKALDNRLTWVVGGLADFTREPSGDSDTNIVSSVPTVAPGGGLVKYTSRFQQNTINSYGVYLSGTFKITDKLSAEAGYRHVWNDVKAVQAAVSDYTVPNSITPVTAPGVFPSSSGRQQFQVSFQGDIYNFGLSYHLAPQNMVYAGYRRGYKLGGFNSSTTSGQTSFGPETVDDFYLGSKNQFTVAGMRGQFNIEGFYDLYHGMQTSYLSVDSNFNLVTFTTNVPQTTFRGFDLDFALDATSWMTVSGAYTYIDAFNTKWPDLTEAGHTGDLAINPVPYTSRHKVSATVRFHTELPNGIGEIALAPTVTYQGKFYTSPVGIRPPNAQAAVFGNIDMIALGGATNPSYTLVDLRAEWNHIMGSKIDGAINVTNLTNQFYQLGNGATLNFGVQGPGYGPPRMVSVELSSRF